ncbi:hypothetical protein L596_015719 [Steinernema carpocapsae]|uniref:Ground-like domain-containing protein n=1 Tax=Steinernema carpocapsae TaxID=34508 RepID=A0A4U5NGG6_STECR|nr:hypothetical protein L596_015719 [Steinernema carpocapsae]
MRSSVLLALALVACLVVVEGLLFGSGGGGGGGGGGGCGGGCGGCGGRRKKRSVDEFYHDDSDSHIGRSDDACTSYELRSMIKEAIVENDPEKSLLTLNEHLEHETAEKFVAWCSDGIEKFKFATRFDIYCSHTYANVTCNVF